MIRMKFLLGADGRVLDAGDVREVDGGFVGPSVEIPVELADGISLIELDVEDDFTIGAHGCLIKDGALAQLISPEALAELKRDLAGQIDAQVALVYARWLRFEAEYVAREAAARAFLVHATPSAWVTGFAVPAGMSEASAAMLIVSQADSLRNALQDLGALRMEKYKVLGAIDAEVAREEHTRISSSIKVIAEAL